MKNNPLNIRKSDTQFLGEVKSENDFKNFISMEFGYRQAFRIINTYITQYKIDSLKQIIERWQPPTENDTDAYIKFVCDKTKFTPDKKFIKSHPDLIMIIFQMSWMENDIKPNLREIETAYEMIEMQDLQDIYNLIQDNNV